MDLDTCWVCQCCMLTLASGECCSEEHGEMERPMRKFDGEHPSLGMLREHHLDGGVDCGDDCGCGHNTYSTSQCEGCGSYLHGERWAFTLWES